jgi:hypothetical protein
MVETTLDDIPFIPTITAATTVNTNTTTTTTTAAAAATSTTTTTTSTVPVAPRTGSATIEFRDIHFSYPTRPDLKVL